MLRANDTGVHRGESLLYLQATVEPDTIQTRAESATKQPVAQPFRLPYRRSADLLGGPNRAPFSISPVGASESHRQIYPDPGQ